MRTFFDRHIKRNILFAFLFLLALRLKFYFTDFPYSVEHAYDSNNFFFLFYYSFEVLNSWSHFILSGVFILIQAIYLNSVLNKHLIFKHNNDYLLLVFIGISAMSIHSYYLSIPLIINFFSILLLDHFFYCIKGRTTQNRMFLLSFVATLLGLLYPPALFVVLMMFVMFPWKGNDMRKFRNQQFIGLLTALLLFSEIIVYLDLYDDWLVYFLHYWKTSFHFDFQVSAFLIVYVLSFLTYVLFFQRNVFNSYVRVRLLFNYFAASSVFLFVVFYFLVDTFSPFNLFFLLPMGYMITYIGFFFKKKIFKIGYLCLWLILSFWVI